MLILPYGCFYLRAIIFHILVHCVFSQNYSSLNLSEIEANKSLPNVPEQALLDLFTRYGDGQKLTFDGFMHLIHNLGLNVDQFDHDVQDHKANGSFIPFHETTLQDRHGLTSTAYSNLPAPVLSGTSNERKRRSSVNQVKENSSQAECLDAQQLFHSDGSQNNTLSKENFLLVCPVLIQQLDKKLCSQNFGPHIHSYNDEKSQSIGEIPAEVWLCSLGAVVIISLVGVATVAVIPLTRKSFYNHVLQFLVAVAVGSLTGDACLHLIPHALGEKTHGSDEDHAHDEGSHRRGVLRGLVVLSGIYIFFLMERLMAMLTAQRRKHHQEHHKKPHTTSSTQNALSVTEVQKLTDGQLPHATEPTSCEEVLMVVHANKDVKGFVEDAHHDVHQDCLEDSKSLRVHSHHGHSHDGPLPQSVSSVAWMVIMGDGLHNFSDGMAIGASFANSLSGGLSTSVAVFCHELPHELGDFAMLLRAGMSVKQALHYNCLSSFLCLLGMLVGVAIGNITSASLWVFALIGGMFLYIALVDMLPEMMAVDPKSGENPFLHLALQMLGMMIGTGIMLVIALFENSIAV